jgi:hypothetical protein
MQPGAARREPDGMWVAREISRHTGRMSQGLAGGTRPSGSMHRRAGYFRCSAFHFIAIRIRFFPLG